MLIELLEEINSDSGGGCPPVGCPEVFGTILTRKKQLLKYKFKVFQRKRTISGLKMKMLAKKDC